MINILLLIIAIIFFVLAAIVGFGWATIDNSAGLVPSGLAFFAAAHLPFGEFHRS